MATVDERAAELRHAWWGEPYPRDASGDWETAPNGDKERWRQVASVAPAPPVTPGLLAAAQAIDAMREWIVTTNCTCSICVAMDALRAELAAATAGPVALTDEELDPMLDAIWSAEVAWEKQPDPGESSYRSVARDAVIAKLNDLGYDLVRRPS